MAFPAAIQSGDGKAEAVVRCADWGPFDLNLEQDTFKKLELYNGKDSDASNQQEDAELLAEDAAAAALVKSLAIREAREGDTSRDDDP